MMESVAHGAKGAAGMGSPTANRMKARAAEGKIPLVAALAGETSGIGWRIISEPVAAAMLNGFDIITDKPEDDVKIKQLFDEMRIWQGVERATVLKRHQGWSVLVMGDEWVRSHGANWITPSNDWFSDYNDPLFGLPEGWRIQLKSPIGGKYSLSRRIHYCSAIQNISRCMVVLVSSLVSRYFASLMQHYSVLGCLMS